MPFAYYKRLSRSRQAIYRRSDRAPTIELPNPRDLHRAVAELERALGEDDPRSVAATGQQIADGVCRQLQVPLVQLTVLAARPSDSYGELHGLYEPSPDPYRSRVTLWMRTRQQRRVVAFRTFLRTLLHELLHHLDYELLGLDESFHTEGFYRRESSLFRQLIGDHDR